VALCATGGYALAKFRFRGRRVVFIGVLASQMLPFQLLIVPLFLLIVNLRLVETYWGAVIPLAAHPIGLFFMRQYMLGLPDHMLDAARVDGANEYRMFWSIVLPNVRPALATMFILFALEYWNNLLWPLIVFRNPTNMPLAVGLASMVNQYKVSYDLLLAGTALATLPVILLFLVLRRQFMEGTASLGTGAQ
jgi:ABC-type glycerol-3-phosphate transport system permease component